MGYNGRAVSEAAHRAGDRVGPYRLIESLGVGSFAEVWFAEPEAGGEPAALKILHRRHLRSKPEKGPSMADRFVEEARLCAQLRIDGLVEVREVIDERPAGSVAIVMERLVGADFAQAADRLSLPDLLGALARVAEILDKLHERGVIHRDVKPTNMFLCEPPLPGGIDRSVRLLDLGIAKSLVVPTVSESTATGVFVGTLQTMAPETVARCSGEDVEISGAVDQWGIGVSLYACLSGRTPFSADGVWPLLRAIAEANVPALVLRPRFGDSRPPESIRAIVRRCLAKEPQDRYPDAGALGQALRDAAMEVREAGHPGEEPPTLTPSAADVAIAEADTIKPSLRRVEDEPATLQPELPSTMHLDEPETLKADGLAEMRLAEPVVGIPPAGGTAPDSIGPPQVPAKGVPLWLIVAIASAVCLLLGAVLGGWFKSG